MNSTRSASSVDDLIAFLKARLAKDEEMATWARGTIPVRRPGDGSGNVRPFRRVDEQTLDIYSAIFRPERILAEVEAKQRILDLHHVQDARYEGEDVGLRCAECGYNAEYSDLGGWCETVRLLALPYADHHDYREEWKP